MSIQVIRESCPEFMFREPDCKVSSVFCHKLNLFSFLQMTALKSANKELKGMMKTVKIQDIDVCNHLISFFTLTFHALLLLRISGAEQLIFLIVELARRDDGPNGCEY